MQVRRTGAGELFFLRVGELAGAIEKPTGSQEPQQPNMATTTVCLHLHLTNLRISATDSSITLM
jgi:hypothetical protein